MPYASPSTSSHVHAQSAAIASGGPSITISYTEPNRPPVANDDSYTTNEDTTLTINEPGVLSNDTDSDGDALSATLVSGPTRGTLTLNANGSFTYTPATNFNGPDSFTYKAHDGSADSAVATVNIAVTAVNDAPVARDDAIPVGEGDAVGGSVLANDTDVDGDALEAVLVSGPANGTLQLNANGTFDYTHNGSETTSDSFTYKASDGSLDSNVAKANISVSPRNDVPTVALSEGGCPSYTSAQGMINLSLADDADPDNLLLSATSSNQALLPNSNITLDGSGENRTMTVRALNNRSGTAQITLTASDQGGLSATELVTVKVGTNKVNTLSGTTGADMLFGLGAADTLDGLQGNDLLCSGNGNDIMKGGDGEDTLRGGPGNDRLNGGDGNDTLGGGRDNDRLTGDVGADSFSGGGGTDTATDFNASEGDTKDSTIP